MSNQITDHTPWLDEETGAVLYDPEKGMSTYAKSLWRAYPYLTKTHVTTVARLESTKSTGQMSALELAKVYAAHVGHGSREGGWIYSATGKPIVQGWVAYAARLEASGRIVVGKGINWSKKGVL